ncbi:angiopoietin-2 isoform X3 [Physeter macrocephalus]|uniref:Angiopoietin-2 isoform X3 n=1 Tax=Physeter macrocephalus TaxID=9755 RepID=A0A455AYS3_PHYMC|nr:angiopoietin-2 isoform X3 [Physeter catodon]|eukprot:XP_028336981.1 angiopoietin-2 isoform X3 [Physeter catodon]
MWQLVLLTLSCDLVLAAAYSSFRRSVDSVGKRQYQVQHGSCSYTFLLPETDNCRSPPGAHAPSALQRDAPLDYDDSVQRLQVLESIMENNTQWLMKLENYIQDNMKKEMVEIQQNAVQNQTAVMIEIGTNLLNQTAEQTRKLTDVEAQVLNQTTRLELQLLEHSLSTNKLEKQILDQTSEINKLQDKNSFLEKKVLDMEDNHIVQLRSIKEEKDQLQVLVSKQNSIIEELEKQLVTATVNNSVLQKQQHDLMETVHNLLTMISTSNSAKHSLIAKEEQIIFRDCAEALKSGLTASGIYTLTFPNSTEEVKAYCDMETAGGGWTVIQRREDGSVDFQRTWKEYKVGFGNPSGEHWLGNEFVSQVTNQKRYVLKIHLKDWEGNEAYSLYDHFYLSSEELNYRIHLKGLTGTAGKISSISQPGNDFSTKDADNDKCICKCSQMLTGGGVTFLSSYLYWQGRISERERLALWTSTCDW